MFYVCLSFHFVGHGLVCPRLNDFCLPLWYLRIPFIYLHSLPETTTAPTTTHLRTTITPSTTAKPRTTINPTNRARPKTIQLQRASTSAPLTKNILSGGALATSTKITHVIHNLGSGKGNMQSSISQSGKLNK